MNAEIPNFSSLRALILHRPDSNCVALRDQMKRLGMDVSTRWPPSRGDLADCDLIFFDADQGFDEMFPWPPGQSPLPLIAIVGSETPGRLEWSMRQRPAAHVLKPIGSNGVFHAIFTAINAHAHCARVSKKIADLEYRLQCRPLVVRAIMNVMLAQRCADEEAYGLLRTASMRRQMTIEDLSKQVIDGFQLDYRDLAAHFARSRHGPAPSATQ